MSATEENSNDDSSFCSMREVCWGNVTSPRTSFLCFINSVVLTLHSHGSQRDGLMMLIIFLFLLEGNFI